MATSDAQTSNRAIITVLGSDCPGIVAAVSGALAEREANILDISQTILQGIFTMTMLVELGESVEFSELKGKLDDLSESLGVQSHAPARGRLPLHVSPLGGTPTHLAGRSSGRAAAHPRRHRDQLWNQGHWPHPHLA